MLKTNTPAQQSKHVRGASLKLGRAFRAAVEDGNPKLAEELRIAIERLGVGRRVRGAWQPSPVVLEAMGLSTLHLPGADGETSVCGHYRGTRRMTPERARVSCTHCRRRMDKGAA